MHIDVRDIALGTGAKYGGQRNAERRDVICDQTFLFKSQGWQNVHVAGSAWTIVDSMMIILLAVPVDDDDRLFSGKYLANSVLFQLSCKGEARRILPQHQFLGLESTIMDCLVYKSTEIKVVTYGKAICGSKLLLLRLTICFIVADSRALISKSSGLLRRLVEIWNMGPKHRKTDTPRGAKTLSVFAPSDLISSL